MKSLLCVMLVFFVPHRSTAQLAVEVDIKPDPSKPTLVLDPSQFAGVNSFSGIMSQTVDTELVAEKCTPGTYSSTLIVDGINTQTCVPCAAGTASAVSGASDASTCVPCITGSFSFSGSSSCTDCPANTFSVTPQATGPTACLSCPANTTAPARSDNVDKCVCVNSYFPSTNLLNAYPYDAVPIVLSLSGAASINYAHVTC